MKIFLIIYVISVIVSFPPIIQEEKKMGIRRGLLWWIPFTPLWNSWIVLNYIVNRLKK